MFKTKLPTVSGVLAAFRTAVTELENVAAAQTAEAEKQGALAVEAAAAEADAKAEAANALSIKSRMEAIFG